MALALDTTLGAVSTVNQSAGGTTTQAYTMGSVTNGILVVGIGTWNNGGTATGLSGVTFNGNAMTLVVGSTGGSGDHYAEFWKYINPPAGTFNIIATVSGKTDKLGLVIASFSGADQTTGIDTQTNTTGTVASVTASLTLAATNEYMIDSVMHVSANNPSAHSDTQILSNAVAGMSSAGQYGLKTGSGSQSMSWTYPDPGDGWAYSVIAVKAATGAAAPITFITYRPAWRG